MQTVEDLQTLTILTLKSVVSNVDVSNCQHIASVDTSQPGQHCYSVCRQRLFQQSSRCVIQLRRYINSLQVQWHHNYSSLLLQLLLLLLLLTHQQPTSAMASQLQLTTTTATTTTTTNSSTAYKCNGVTTTAHYYYSYYYYYY